MPMELPAGKTNNSRSILSSILICLIIIFSWTAPAVAQAEGEQYVIGPTDVLSVTFWQEPDLNSEVRVGEDGLVTLPVIGEIKAAGLTTAQLAKNIIDQMAFYQTPVSQATVVVREFNSRAVFVSGEVTDPSRQSFERIPDLWRVIMNAGGPTERADLSRVTIIRKEGEQSRVIKVDLASIIKDGDLSKAPALQPGDMVNVPATPFGTTMQLGESTEFEGRNIYFVLGSVAAPGVRNLEGGVDVLDAITLAGGFTPEADLKNIRVVMKGPRYSKVVKINLEKYVSDGSPPRFILHAEDTIFVPSRRVGVFSAVMARIGTIIPVVTAIGTIVLLTR